MDQILRALGLHRCECPDPDCEHVFRFDDEAAVIQAQKTQAWTENKDRLYVMVDLDCPWVSANLEKILASTDMLALAYVDYAAHVSAGQPKETYNEFLEAQNEFFEEFTNQEIYPLALERALRVGVTRHNLVNHV